MAPEPPLSSGLMRLAVLSPRAFKNPVSLDNFLPALEDALASYDDATLVLCPPFRARQPNSARPSWLRAIRTVRHADTVFWAQMSARPTAPVWALAYTRPLARRSAFVIDGWVPKQEEIGRVATLQRLAVCFVAFKEAHDRLRSDFPRIAWEWLPFAVNTEIVRDLGLERDVFAYWMGRRYEPLHLELQRYCEERGLEYFFHRKSGEFPTYGELARMMARSRYFVVTPPNLENPERTGPMSPVVMRYFEGLAAGCRLVGVMPNPEEYRALLPDDALIQCKPDGSDLATVLDSAERDPTVDERMHAAHDRVHQEHTWERRAAAIHARLAAG